MNVNFKRSPVVDFLEIAARTFIDRSERSNLLIAANRYAIILQNAGLRNATFQDIEETFGGVDGLLEQHPDAHEQSRYSMDVLDEAFKMVGLWKPRGVIGDTQFNFGL